MPAYRDPITNRFATRPNPVKVAAMVNRANTDARYAAQIERAQSDRSRRADARRAGYRGPLTRRDLASAGYTPTAR